MSQTKRIPTPEVGESRWIEVRKLTWGERKRFLKALEKALQSPESQLELAEKVILDLLTGWNWVGPDGEPLPLPKTSEDLDQMLDEDVVLLLEKIIEAVQSPFKQS